MKNSYYGENVLFYVRKLHFGLCYKNGRKKIMNLVLYTFEEDEGNFHWVRSTKQYEDSS